MPAHGRQRFRRVLIVHGFGATPEDHWFPWFEERVDGGERIALPDSLRPVASSWVPIVASAIGTLEPDTAIVAHSLGNATTVQAIRSLREHGDTGSIGAFVAVAPFARTTPPVGFPELDTFLATEAPAFFDGLDLRQLRGSLGDVHVIRSDDDPLVPAPLSDEFAAALDAPVDVVPGAGHFLGSDGTITLPQALAALGRA